MKTELFKTEFIYETASFPSCHASTIETTAEGGLIAAWFGGTEESAPDVGIYVARRVEGRWTAPVEVVNGVQSDQTRVSCYNPVLFQPKSGPLLLFYKVGSHPSHWWGMMTFSEDGGSTWTAPWRLPEGILGPIKNKPIQLPDGDILCPSSSEAAGWTVHFERLHPADMSWETTGTLNNRKEIAAIQPALLSLEHGHLRAIGRTKQEKLFAIDSFDEGRTWGPMRLLDVPNPDSGIDAVTLRDGRFLLVYNPTVEQRTPLTIAISTEAQTWEPCLTLEDGPGEFSYPAVIQTLDGRIHITHTWNRKRIRHVEIGSGGSTSFSAISKSFPRSNIFGGYDTRNSMVNA